MLALRVAGHGICGLGLGWELAEAAVFRMRVMQRTRLYLGRPLDLSRPNEFFQTLYSDQLIGQENTLE